MRFLITGGNGQLGREWVDHLTSRNAEFHSFSSTDLDITKKEIVEKKLQSLKPDVLINCAAYTKVDQAEDEREKAFKINAEAVKHLAKICKKLGIKLVHYSTDYVFPGTEEDHQKLENGYPEDHPTNPINVYGSSKLAGEQAVQESGCEYLIIRVAWLCGKHGQNFVKTMIRLGNEKKELRVVDDQFGCPTFTKNVVENSFQLLKAGEYGIFHLSSLGKITWYDLANEIFKLKNMNLDVQPVNSAEFPTKAKRPAFSLLDTQKIANISGISLIDWKTGLQNLLNESE